MEFNQEDLGIMLHACNPRILDAEARRWQQIQDLADEVHSEFKASQDFPIRYCQKTNQAMHCGTYQ